MKKWEGTNGTFLDLHPKWDNPPQYTYLSIEICGQIFIGRAKVENVFPIGELSKITYRGVGKLIKVPRLKYWWFTRVRGMHPSAIFYKLGGTID